MNQWTVVVMLGVSHLLGIKGERMEIEEIESSLLYFILWIIQYKNKTASSVKHFLRFLLFYT